MIKVILFDLGGTLVHYHGKNLADLSQQSMHLLLETLKNENKLSPELVTQFKWQFASLVRKAWDTHEEQTWPDTLQQTCRALGLPISKAQARRYEVLYFQTWQKETIPFPETIKTLQTLFAQGHRLGLVSNAAFSPDLMLSQVRRLELLSFFDHLFFSSAVGVRKPEPAIYQLALDTFQVSPSECVFIGDRILEDVRAPKSLGLRTIFRCPERLTSPCEADACVDSLEEVIAIIPTW